MLILIQCVNCCIYLEKNHDRNELMSAPAKPEIFMEDDLYHRSAFFNWCAQYFTVCNFTHSVHSHVKTGLQALES